MTDKAPEFIWAVDKVDLGQYVHRDTYQTLEAENVKLKAELREASMQSLADLGQAQEAYEAQLKAEAQLERFRGYMVDIAIDYINNCSEGYMKFANKKMEEKKDEV